MKSSTWLVSLRALILRLAAVYALGGVGTLCAATLTGVVKQPEVPYAPAPSSTVIVYDEVTNSELFKNTTGKDGRYRFKVDSGTRVIVRATWRTDASMPGTTKTIVLLEPTTADVFLQPKKTASMARWFTAGSETAIRSGAAVDFTAGQLRNDGLPADAIYEFIQGARSSKPESFDELHSYAIFSIPTERLEDRKVVTLGLMKAQGQWKSQRTIPTYRKLRADVDGPLSEIQYVEIIGLISPPDGEDQMTWESAVKTAVDPELQPKVFKSAESFGVAFEQKDGMQSANAGGSDKPRT